MPSQKCVKRNRLNALCDNKNKRNTSFTHQKVEIPKDFLEIPTDFLKIPTDFLKILRDFLEIPKDFREIPKDFLEIPRIPRDS